MDAQQLVEIMSMENLFSVGTRDAGASRAFDLLLLEEPAMSDHDQRRTDLEARTPRHEPEAQNPVFAVPRRRPKTLEQAVKLAHVLQQIAAAAL